MIPSDTRQREMAINALAIGAGILVKKGLEKTYKEICGEAPPNAVVDREVDWPKALSWAFVAGTLIYGVRIGIKRWGGKKLTDRYEPDLKQSDIEVTGDNN